MFSININKSPGHDGCGGGFFRSTQNIVRDDITEAIFEFFRSGKILKQMNATMISLSPIVVNPMQASQFRPISCCNVIYTCISNVICTKLLEVILSIVNNTRATFVKESSLVHNILICHDLFGYYNRKIASLMYLMKPKEGI